MVSQCKFVKAHCLDLSVKRATAHFCAQTAGVFLLAHVEYNLGNIGFHNFVRNAQFVAIFLHGRVRVGRKSHIHGDSAQFKVLVGKFAKSVHKGKQCKAVLSAGNSNGNFVALVYHFVIVHCPPKVG